MHDQNFAILQVNMSVKEMSEGDRLSDTVSPKLFSAAVENIMRHLDQEDSGVQVEGRFSHRLSSLTILCLAHRTSKRRNERRPNSTVKSLLGTDLKGSSR
ncbi:unnamed protein product [Haemonchus placei]|uniref:COMM domain-containing protein n=1 Tax=Haemonchus placei TaxID=6290 RepID=A0A0N4WDP3_HAEPC|nr:unnamed protein product [Haemonchus placei]